MFLLSGNQIAMVYLSLDGTQRTTRMFKEGVSILNFI